jgi:hypothetical protein
MEKTMARSRKAKITFYAVAVLIFVAGAVLSI